MGYVDRNRYSFSGADAAAYAYFPQGGDYNQLLRLQDDVEFATLEVDRLLNDIDRDVGNSSLFEARGRAAESKQKYQSAVDSTKWIHLQAIHTVAISVHEAKAPVRALGHQSVRGFTRSSRTIAGSLIFTVIDGHPLETLMIYDPSIANPSIGEWSMDRWTAGIGDSHWPGRSDAKISTKLPPFNMHIRYATEMPGCPLAGQDDFEHSQYTLGQMLSDTPNHLLNPQQLKLKRKMQQTPTASGYLHGHNPSNIKAGVNAATLLLLGIELVDQGMVTSVNDMVTEITYSFIAKDFRDLARIKHVQLDLPGAVAERGDEWLTQELNWCESTIRQRQQWTRENWRGGGRRARKASGDESQLNYRDRRTTRAAANKACREISGELTRELRRGEVRVDLDQVFMEPEPGQQSEAMSRSVDTLKIDRVGVAASPLPPNCYWQK
jgi:hypothetical protein